MFLHPGILFPCCDTAADMTFGFVLLQDLFYLLIDPRIDFFQSICNVLMFRRYKLELFPPVQFR